MSNSTMLTKIPADIAERIWDVCVRRCGASPSEEVGDHKDTWMADAIEGRWASYQQYRFQGNLGSGGKLEYRRDSFSVQYYKEDRTPWRVAAAETANKELQTIWDEYSARLERDNQQGGDRL